MQGKEVLQMNAKTRAGTNRRSRGSFRILTILPAALLLWAVSGTATAVLIGNGTVTLGVNPQGNLIDPAFRIGLTFDATGGEALYPGCLCEGWGIGDPVTGVFGKAGESFGDANVTVESFTSTADTAESIVTVGGAYRVTHEFFPSASPNLFEVAVTVENISEVGVEVRYRRAMDWDVPPTEFTEFVTIGGWPATTLIASNDNGFADGNPLIPASPLNPATSNVNFEDNGPTDHGAVFDYDFGVLAPGETVEFSIFYGAAATEADALTALSAVSAEVYSLGQPNTPTGDTVGDPNTFIFGFAGVGGTPVGPRTCLEDDRTGDFAAIDTESGAYTMTDCGRGVTVSGTATITESSCWISLYERVSGRVMEAVIDKEECGDFGQLSIVDRATRTLRRLTDTNLADSDCGCDTKR
jgi:hypothetical protein